MKTQLLLFLSLVLLLLHGNLFAQHPDNIRATYTLDVNNRSITPNTFEYDVLMKWTNYPGSGATNEVPDFEYSGGQYFFDCDSAIRGGGVVTMQNAGSDLPTNMQPRNPTVFFDATTGKLQLRWAINTFPGVGNGYHMPGGNVERKIMRVRLQTTRSQFPNVPLNLLWRNALPNPFTKIFQYSLSSSNTNAEITTPQTHTISIPNDPIYVSPFINANFYSSTRTIVAGQFVNFFDSTTNYNCDPYYWNWTFEGGNPQVSEERNPVGIRYDEPGSYSVSLYCHCGGHSSSITKQAYITVLAGCFTNWTQNIKISDAGSGIDSLKFGMSPNGTNGSDTCLGETVIPPPPPLGVFDCRFILPSNDAVKNDFRRDTAVNYTWRMTFQPSGSGYPFTFNWSPSTLPPSGSFYLKDEITGTLVNVNMRTQSSYTLTTQGITSLKIEHTYNAPVTTSVISGWNMVSVPLRTADMLYSSLFPGVASQAYAYSNGYVSVSMLSNGTAYWMRFNNPVNFEFIGYPYQPEYMNVVQGWNLIGPFDKNIPVGTIVSNPSGIVNSYYFGYNGTYRIADTLKRGQGYWVRSTGTGYLFKGGGDNSQLAVSENPIDKFTELRLSTEEQGSASLYLARPEEIASDYSLPPVPPSGIFDARFGSDTYVESTGKVNTLKLSSNEGQVKLTVHNAKGMKLRIKDAIDGTILNAELTEGTEVTIPSGLTSVLVESGNATPLTYDLAQNYPNPFNPSTKIKYQIPKDGHVKIIVYDVLGREAMRLIDEFRTAGAYEIKFEASGLTSGVYFYRMTSGSFDDIKKMIILK